MMMSTMEIYARLKIPQTLSNFLARRHCTNETPPDHDNSEMQYFAPESWEYSIIHSTELSHLQDDAGVWTLMIEI
jgi:hypothetical protein